MRNDNRTNNTSTDIALSVLIENALVARNPRGMKTLQRALEPGYCLRAAQLLRDIKGTVLIGTGFPVVDTFETDGPVGAIALYNCLEYLGAEPVIVCGPPMSTALASSYRVHEIKVGPHDQREEEALQALERYQPALVLSIERPGQAEDGHYYNMRGEDISARAACFDTYLKRCQCPSIAIGDGGNEIGMGNVKEALGQLDINAAHTCCDELIVADVSNWGAYGIIAFLGLWRNEDLLGKIEPLKILQYLSALGSVDGVTRRNELTEDGLSPDEGAALLLQLRRLVGMA